jgi:solute carrier family 13 (sodium-dependent dicarboxylate transporter), member 2/3/5
VAMVASLCMFLCPRGDGDDPRAKLLNWKCANEAPWGILIMFDGGLCLAQGFEKTGLSAAIGEQLSVFSTAPAWLVIVGVCLVVTFMTEITSSTATASLLLPILGELAVATGMSPASVMIPGVISASCAFMLPVATAPNAIIFSVGGIRTDEMAKVGLVLNFFAVAVISMLCFWLLA